MSKTAMSLDVWAGPQSQGASHIESAVLRRWRGTASYIFSRGSGIRLLPLAKLLKGQGLEITHHYLPSRLVPIQRLGGYRWVFTAKLTSRPMLLPTSGHRRNKKHPYMT